MSFTTLLLPAWWSLRNGGRRRARLRPRLAIALTAAACIGVGSYWLFGRFWSEFQGLEVFGQLILQTVLGMIFLTFLTVLIFSNMISALSRFFLAEDLPLILPAPVSAETLFLSRLAETAALSSWMPALFGLPVLIAFGASQHAHPSYYALLPAVLLPFLAVPAVAGTGITLMLARVFPARRAREVLLLAALVVGALAYLLLRFLQPERLVDPDAFQTLGEYLAALGTARNPFLPSTWAGQVLLPALAGRWEGVPLPLTSLWTTAAASVVLGQLLARQVYGKAFGRSQESQRARPGTWIETWDRWGAAREKPAPPLASIVGKDLRTFFRDSSQWSQLFLVGALVAVYLYNYSALPLDSAPFGGGRLKDLVGLVNVGLAGFVLTALSARFVYPALSLEAKTWWVLKGAPFPLRVLLHAKLWTAFLPLMAVGEVLVALTNHILGVHPYLRMVGMLTIGGVALMVACLALAFGARHPPTEAEDAARTASSHGGMVFMLAALGCVAALVAVQALPSLDLLIRLRHWGSAGPGVWLRAAGAHGLAAAFAWQVSIRALRRAHRGLEEVEV